MNRIIPATRTGSTLARSTLALAALLAAGCGGRDDAAQTDRRTAAADPPAGEPARLTTAADLGPPHLLAFACGTDWSYLAVHDPAAETILLYTPEGPRTLAPQPAASGARYGDDRYVLWSKGVEEISLEVDGRQLPACAAGARQRLLTAAYQGGYDLRAAGNEPGWMLLMGPEQIRLDRLGHVAASFPGLSAAERQGSEPIVRETAVHTLRVTVSDEFCRDTMSGEPSPAVVVIELDGATLRGCGVRLRPDRAAP